MDTGWFGVDQGPDPGGGCVAEDRLIAAVQERGDQEAIERQSRVSKCVDMGMNAVEPTGLGPSRDRGAGQAGSLQLMGTQNAVLSFRKLRKPFCVDFVSLSETNLTQIGHDRWCRRKTFAQDRRL
jgi:hypothetical protein